MLFSPKDKIIPEPDVLFRFWTDTTPSLTITVVVLSLDLTLNDVPKTRINVVGVWTTNGRPSDSTSKKASPSKCTKRRESEKVDS